LVFLGLKYGQAASALRDYSTVFVTEQLQAEADSLSVQTTTNIIRHSFGVSVISGTVTQVF